MSYTDKVQKIIDIAKTLTLLEAKEVVDAFKAEFNVEPAAGGGVIMAAAATGGGGAPAAKAEPTEFNVVLKAFGDKKVEVIKVVRTLTGLGLKEAKDLVEAAPKSIKEGIDKAEAEKLAGELKNAGATVDIVPVG